MVTTTAGAPADALTAALAACMAEIGVCHKDREMTYGDRYSYLSDDQIMARAQPVLARHGVIVAPQAMQVVDTLTVATKKGSMPGIRLLVTWIVMCREGGSITLQTIGDGADSGDKATNKAMTAARKYLFRLLFSIPTEDDPDHERPELAHSAPARQPSPPQPPPPDPDTAARRELYIAARDVLPADALPAVTDALRGMTGSQLRAAISVLDLSGAERAEAIHSLFGVSGM